MLKVVEQVFFDFQVVSWTSLSGKVLVHSGCSGNIPTLYAADTGASLQGVLFAALFSLVLMIA